MMRAILTLVLGLWLLVQFWKAFPYFATVFIIVLLFATTVEG